jgi:hypothetical protein
MSEDWIKAEDADQGISSDYDFELIKIAWCGRLFESVNLSLLQSQIDNYTRVHNRMIHYKESDGLLDLAIGEYHAPLRKTV